MLPNDDRARKAIPIFTGLLAYFPDALAAVAEHSRRGNDKHNPGQPMHWARDKSTNHIDTAVRHLVDHHYGMSWGVGGEIAGGKFVPTRFDSDGNRHLAAAAWRILAALQTDIEQERDETAQEAEGINEGCYQVGTSGFRKLDYNAGPSGWLPRVADGIWQFPQYKMNVDDCPSLPSLLAISEDAAQDAALAEQIAQNNEAVIQESNDLRDSAEADERPLMFGSGAQFNPGCRVRVMQSELLPWRVGEYGTVLRCDANLPYPISVRLDSGHEVLFLCKELSAP